MRVRVRVRVREGERGEYGQGSKQVEVNVMGWYGMVPNEVGEVDR